MQGILPKLFKAVPTTRTVHAYLGKKKICLQYAVSEKLQYICQNRNCDYGCSFSACVQWLKSGVVVLRAAKHITHFMDTTG